MIGLRGVRSDKRRIGAAAQPIIFSALLLGAMCLPAESAWTVVGPAGGDARAFAAFPGQPKHLLLGTTNSWLYESTDEGGSWHRLAKLGTGDGLGLARILGKPRHPAT